MLSDPQPRRRDLTGLALLAGSLIYLQLLALRGAGWIDEGFALNAAQRIHDGEFLYRDFFAPYGPGRHHILAWVFDLLGSRILVARSLWIALMGLTAVGLYRVGLRLVPRPWALAAAAYFVLVPPQAFKVFSPGGYTLMALATIRALERPSPGRRLVAGFAVGVCGLFRFELWGAGAVLLLALWILGFRAPARDRSPAGLVLPAAGALLPIVGFLLFYGTHGLLPGIAHYEAMQKAQLAQFFALPLPSPLTALQAGTGTLDRVAGTFDAIAAWVPGALTLAALAGAFRRRSSPRRSDGALVLLALACGLSQITFFTRPDFDHLLHVTPIAVLLLVALLHRRRDGLSPRRAGVWIGFLFLAGFAASAMLRHPAEGFSLGRIRVDTERVDTGLRGSYLDTPYKAEVFRGLRRVVDSIGAEAGPGRDRIVFLKFGGFWYYTLGLQDPIPQEPLSTYSGGDGRASEEEGEIIRAIEDAAVRYVILEEPDPRFSVVPAFRTIHPRLADYLAREFRRTPVRVGEWVVLVRRDPAAASAP